MACVLALILGPKIFAQDEPSCHRVVTVYIDLSETMTLTANLSEVARILQKRFTESPALVAPGDALTINVFGSDVRPFFSSDSISEGSLDALGNDLTVLMGPQWQQLPQLSGPLQNRDFVLKTNFAPVLRGIADLLKKGTNQRNVILIASDLSHDPDNDKAAGPERIRGFDVLFNATLAQPDALDAFQSTPERDARAHLMLLQVQPARQTDKDVAARVVERFNELHPSSTKLLIEDPTQLDAKLQRMFSSAVRVERPRRTTESTVAFTLVNPCGSAIVSAVRIGPVRGDSVPLDVFPLKGGPVQLGERDRRDLSITDERLKAWAGSTLQIQPVFDGKVESQEFFFGDSLAFEGVTPELFPRFLGTGTVILRGRAEVMANEGHDYTIIINHDAFPTDQRSFTFHVKSSAGRVDKRNLDLALEVPREIIKKIPVDARLEYELKAEDPAKSTVVDRESGQVTKAVKYPVVARYNEYEAVVFLTVFMLMLLIAFLRSWLGKAAAALALLGAVGTMKDLLLIVASLIAGNVEISISKSAPTALVSMILALAGAGVFYYTVRTTALLLFFDRIETDPLWRRRASRSIVTFSVLVGVLVFGGMLYALGWNGHILETHP